ncbi:hypothetical protein [Rhodoferax sp.]|uniref:hypothetical protein n=1 Tax=Rhodoferax sp. TaxID=50421 RepID=UPI00262047E4|nr:hypothetical protein [Rhodoferax sp.]MDD2923711.1 hypothetical protein [Rhodoferax sp.]
MKHRLGLRLLLVVALLPVPLLAQAEEPLNIEAERERIARERAHHEAVFLQAERDCYARFAVSDCLQQARKDRRAALDPLRRQELVLNDIERKSRAVQALDRIQNKVSEQQQGAIQRQAEPKTLAK